MLFRAVFILQSTSMLEYKVLFRETSLSLNFLPRLSNQSGLQVAIRAIAVPKVASMVAFPGDILDFGNSVRFISSLAWLVMSLCGQPPQAPIVATWKLFSKSNVYYLRDKSHYVNTLQYCYSIVHDPNFPSTERVHIAKQERALIYQRDLFLLIFS